MQTKFSSRTPWREKLQRVQQRKVVDIPPGMQRRFGSGTMLIPKPLDVDALIRRIPKGRLVTQSEIRRVLAEQANADVACPITTGIFVRIAAEAANEAAVAGGKRITAFWRVIRDDGSLNPKLPGGIEGQMERLEAEGHRFTAEKTPKLENFERALLRF